MSAHTPGPWRTGAGNLLIIRAGDGHGMAVADIAPPTTRYPDIATEANAYLIAAAPDMHEALTTIDNAFNLDDLSAFTREQQRAIEAVDVVLRRIARGGK